MEKLSTSELFVSFRYGSEIEGLIYTNREEAVIVNEQNNDNFEKICEQYHYQYNENQKRPYKVKTLYDAIEEIKDYVINQIEINRFNNEHEC